MHERIIITHIEELRAAIEQVLTEIGSRVHICEECLYQIKLVLNELAGNSIVYSGKETCLLLYRITPEELIFSIADRGRGCPIKKIGVSKETVCAERLNEGGRGIYLAKCFTETLRYNKKGNIVWGKMTFHR